MHVSSSYLHKVLHKLLHGRYRRSYISDLLAGSVHGARGASGADYLHSWGLTGSPLPNRLRVISFYTLRTGEVTAVTGSNASVPAFRD
jgi:hypothetical protein